MTNKVKEFFNEYYKLTYAEKNDNTSWLFDKDGKFIQKGKKKINREYGWVGCHSSFWNDYNEDVGNAVLTEVTDIDEDTIDLGFLQSGHKDCGHGSYVLSKLCEMADKNGLDITLVAEMSGSRGDGRLNQAQLVKWYKRFGFKLVKGTKKSMIRERGDTK